MSGPDSAFERLRATAKQLTRDCRAADPAALARVQARLPRLAALDPAAAAASVRLADVQHALAREAGVENWAALKERALAEEPLAAQVERFLDANRGGGDRATMLRILAAHPEVARTSIHAACAACDAEAAALWLDRDPKAATATIRIGERMWAPLDCLGASPLFDLDDRHRAASVAIGERLLALGADPNTFNRSRDGDPLPLTALYRASDRGNAGLVRLLLEHGANPNDGESVYHAAEHDHRQVLELLVAHGAEISARDSRWNNTVLYFLAGYRDEQEPAAAATAGMRWLLEHGADPNVGSYEHGETPLHRVAALGRGPAVAEMLLDHGADPRAQRADGRTPYELAMRMANVATAEVLRRRGGEALLRPEDALLGACAAGDAAAARAIADAHPGLLARVLADDREAILAATHAGNAAAPGVLAALGFDLATEGHGGGTALHWAAWHGQVAMVDALLAAGAPVDLRDRTYGSSPIAWAAHGSANCRSADADYIAIIDRLLKENPDRAASYNRWNDPPEALASDMVADHLRARGFAPASEEKVG